MERSWRSADGQQHLPGVHRIARFDRDADDFAAPAGDDVRDHLHGFQRDQFVALVDGLTDADVNRLHHAAQRRDFIARPGRAGKLAAGAGATGAVAIGRGAVLRLATAVS